MGTDGHTVSALLNAGERWGGLPGGATSETDLVSGGLAWFCSTFITAGPGPPLILLVVVAIIKHID